MDTWHVSRRRLRMAAVAVALVAAGASAEAHAAHEAVPSTKVVALPPPPLPAPSSAAVHRGQDRRESAGAFTAEYLRNLTLALPAIHIRDECVPFSGGMGFAVAAVIGVAAIAGYVLTYWRSQEADGRPARVFAYDLSKIVLSQTVAGVALILFSVFAASGMKVPASSLATHVVSDPVLNLKADLRSAQQFSPKDQKKIVKHFTQFANALDHGVGRSDRHEEKHNTRLVGQDTSDVSGPSDETSAPGTRGPKYVKLQAIAWYVPTFVVESTFGVALGILLGKLWTAWAARYGRRALRRAAGRRRRQDRKAQLLEDRAAQLQRTTDDGFTDATETETDCMTPSDAFVTIRVKEAQRPPKLAMPRAVSGLSGRTEHTTATAGGVLDLMADLSWFQRFCVMNAEYGRYGPREAPSAVEMDYPLLPGQPPEKHHGYGTIEDEEEREAQRQATRKTMRTAAVDDDDDVEDAHLKDHLGEIDDEHAVRRGSFSSHHSHSTALTGSVAAKASGTPWAPSSAAMSPAMIPHPSAHALSVPPLTQQSTPVRLTGSAHPSALVSMSAEEQLAHHHHHVRIHYVHAKPRGHWFAAQTFTWCVWTALSRLAAGGLCAVSAVALPLSANPVFMLARVVDQWDVSCAMKQFLLLGLARFVMHYVLVAVTDLWNSVHYEDEVASESSCSTASSVSSAGESPGLHHIHHTPPKATGFFSRVAALAKGSPKHPAAEDGSGERQPLLPHETAAIAVPTTKPPLPPPTPSSSPKKVVGTPLRRAQQAAFLAALGPGAAGAAVALAQSQSDDDVEAIGGTSGGPPGELPRHHQQRGFTVTAARTPSGLSAASGAPAVRHSTASAGSGVLTAVAALVSRSVGAKAAAPTETFSDLGAVDRHGNIVHPLVAVEEDRKTPTGRIVAVGAESPPHPFDVDLPPRDASDRKAEPPLSRRSSGEHGLRYESSATHARAKPAAAQSSKDMAGRARIYSFPTTPKVAPCIPQLDPPLAPMLIGGSSFPLARSPLDLSDSVAGQVGGGSWGTGHNAVGGTSALSTGSLGPEDAAALRSQQPEPQRSPFFHAADNPSLGLFPTPSHTAGAPGLSHHGSMAGPNPVSLTASARDTSLVPVLRDTPSSSPNAAPPIRGEQRRAVSDGLRARVAPSPGPELPAAVVPEEFGSGRPHDVTFDALPARHEVLPDALDRDHPLETRQSLRGATERPADLLAALGLGSGGDSDSGYDSDCGDTIEPLPPAAVVDPTASAVGPSTDVPADCIPDQAAVEGQETEPVDAPGEDVPSASDARPAPPNAGRGKGRGKGKGRRR